MAAGNPIWEQFNALWTLLEAENTFASAVVSGNRIKFTSSALEILKRRVQAGDLPECAVVHVGLGPKDRIASNDTALVCRWEVWITTGEQPIDAFFDLQWAIFLGLIDWDTTMRALTWESENYVKNCELLDTEDSLLNRAEVLGYLNRTKLGWTSMWRGQTWCEFSHSKLIA